MEEILHNCTTPSDVDTTLEKLPASLSEIYMRCLKRKSDGRTVCNPRVLKWCLAAKEPLRVDELQDMLAIDSVTGDVVTRERPDTETVIRSGVSLLTFDDAEMLLIPAHQSVRQFLFSTDIADSLARDMDFGQKPSGHIATSLNDTEREIGQICLHHIRARTGLGVQQRSTMSMSVSAPTTIGKMPSFVKHVLGFQDSRTSLHNIPTRRAQASLEPTNFLAYANRMWLPHTEKFERTSPA